ncbi:MAG TPA: hypothetical protein VFQ16_10000 [Burkholderiaceae bacterium]|nr:hypothetical protein [Burkholderiaceae bacterium]
MKQTTSKIRRWVQALQRKTSSKTAKGPAPTELDVRQLGQIAGGTSEVDPSALPKGGGW